MWSRLECKLIAPKLWDYAAGALEDAAVERVERHVVICQNCCREAEAYRRTVEAVVETRRQCVPESLSDWQSLRLRLESEQRESIRSRPIRLNLAWAGGFAVLLLGVLTARLWFGVEPPSELNELRKSGSFDIGQRQPPPQDPGLLVGPRDQSQLPASSPVRSDVQTVNNSDESQASPGRRSLSQIRRSNRGSLRSAPQYVGLDNNPPVHNAFDRATIDGTIQPAPRRDYVITPAVSTDEPSRNFVMGALPNTRVGSSGRMSSGQPEEAPIW